MIKIATAKRYYEKKIFFKVLPQKRHFQIYSIKSTFLNWLPLKIYFQNCFLEMLPQKTYFQNLLPQKIHFKNSSQKQITIFTSNLFFVRVTIIIHK